MFIAPGGRTASRRVPIALALAAWACAGALPAHAQFANPDRELRGAALAGASHSTVPVVCSPAPSVAYAAWIDDSTGAATVIGDIYFSATTNAGVTWSAPVRINRTKPAGASVGEPREVRLACDASSRVVAGWVEEYTSSHADTFAVSSTDGGATWREAKRLDTDAPTGMHHCSVPDLATDGAGNVYAAWSDGWGPPKVMLAVSTNAGLTWAAPQSLEGGNGGSDTPSVMARAGGFAHVAWASSDGRIFVNSTATTGATWLGAKRLDTDAAPSSSRPRLAIAPGSARVYAAWRRSAAGDSNVYFGASSNNGTSWGAPVRVDHATAGAQAKNPEIAATASVVQVAWEDARSGSAHVWTTRSTNDGATWASPDTRLDAGNTAGSSRLPRVVAAGSHIGIAWLDGRRGTPEPWFNRSHDGGVTWAGELKLAAGTASATTTGSVALANDGASGWFAAWSDRRDDARVSGWHDVFANRSGNNGDTWNASDTRLDGAVSMTRAAATVPAVAADGAGKVAVAWMDERAGQPNVYANCSTDHGTSWLAAAARVDTVAAAGTAAGYLPLVCEDGAGCTYVAWMEPGIGAGPGVYMNRSCDACRTWLATPIRVDHATTPVSWLGGAAMACDATGSVFVAVSDDRVSGSGQENDVNVYVNVSHDRGATWGFANDLKLNETPLTSAWVHGLLTDGAGHVYVQYQGKDSPTGQFHTYVNRSWDRGNTWRGSALAGSGFKDARTAIDAAGGVFVAWSDERNGGTDIYVNRSLAWGDPPWGTEQRIDGDGAPGAYGSVMPAIAADAGNVVVTWLDERAGRMQLYANRSTDHGATWLAGAVRVDTGDAAGAHRSDTNRWNLPLALRGSSVRALWVDDRNLCAGKPGFDAFVNFSEDAGLTWHATPVRAEAGDGAGCSDAAWATLAFTPDRWTHAVWVDQRGDDHTVRINSALAFVDDDGDGVFGPGADCNDGDGSAWARPAEVTGLRFDADRRTLRWTADAAPGATGVTYDLLRSGAATNFTSGATCLATAVTALTAQDTATPAAKSAFHYLVRAGNRCPAPAGTGPLGYGSQGAETAGRSCP